MDNEIDSYVACHMVGRKASGFWRTISAVGEGEYGVPELLFFFFA